MEPSFSPNATRRLVRFNAAIAALFLASAGGCYAAWTSEVRRPEHHGEIAFFYLYAVWAVMPGLAFLLAAALVRHERLGRWRYLIQLIAILSPSLSGFVLWRVVF